MSIILTQDGSNLSFTTDFTTSPDANGNVFTLYYSESPITDVIGLSNVFSYTTGTGPHTDYVDTNGLTLTSGTYYALQYNNDQNIISNSFLFTTSTTTTTRVPTPSTITQADVSGLVLAAGKYTLSENVTVTQPFSADPDTIFDGAGYTITVDAADWPGLFSAPVTVMNLTVSGTPTVANNAGLFFATDISGIAYNCTNTCSVSSHGGGIFGDNSTGVAISCHNTGTIALNGGGIFGSSSGLTARAVGCTNSGELGSAGGIFGINSSGTAINCSNSGVFNGGGAGGIFGAVSTGTAINCFNSAPLFSNCGGTFGSNSTGTATNCYNSGGFSNGVTLAGGIFGWESTGTANHCYNVGNISDSANSHTGAITSNNGSSVTVEITSSTSGGSTEWSDASANLYLTGANGTVWGMVTPNTPFILSPFRTSVEGLLALFMAAPRAVVSLPRTMGIPDSEIAFATALDAKNDSSKYGNLSQIALHSPFTYIPSNAAILYQDRNLDLSGNLNIIVPSDGNSGVNMGIPQ
jgi:hypothetical protein